LFPQIRLDRLQGLQEAQNRRIAPGETISLSECRKFLAEQACSDSRSAGRYGSILQKRTPIGTPRKKVDILVHGRSLFLSALTWFLTVLRDRPAWWA